MKIKKTFQGELPENRIVNAKSNSQTDAYSANYLNDKLRNVVVSPTEPTTGEDVWIKRSSNILKFDDFTKTVNGITFTMKDQVLHVEGTATAYTQECYLPINLTLEEAMTLTVDWSDDNLVPKAAYTYNGTSYYPNIYSQELEPGTYLNQLYFIIASGATVNTDVRFQLEKGRGFSGWQPVMEKAILVKNNNDVYEDLIKKSIHVGVDKPKNGEDVWVQIGKNLYNPSTDIELVGKFRQWNYSGAITDQSNYNGLKIRVKPNTTYVTDTDVSDGDYHNLCYFDENMVFLSSEPYNTKPKHFTTPNNCAYITIAILNEYTWFKLEEGTTITAKRLYTKDANGGYEEFYNDEKLEIYSTEERRIGIWIDGKPLYRKVVTFNITTEEEYTVDHNISNVNHIFVDCNSFITSKGVSSMPLTNPSTNISDSYYYNKHYTRVTVTPTQIKAHIGGYTNSGWGNVYVILNYTKTTD